MYTCLWAAQPRRHCLSARDSRGQAVPNALGNLGVGIPVYPLAEPESAPTDDDKIISTEGCYSCQLNGGSLSPAKHRRTRHLGDHQAANTTSHRVTRRFRKSTHRKRTDAADTSEHHKRRHDHSDWDLVKVGLSLDEAQQGRNILDIRPAYKHLRNDTNYHVLHGVDKDHFRVVSSEGGVTLQLSEAIAEPGVYKVNIGSRIATEEESQHHNRAFRLRVHVTVTK